MKYIYAIALVFFLNNTNAQHNNELYNDGALITVQSGASIYVQGDVHNYKATATLNNNGLIEVQGNMHSDALFQQRGTGTVRIANHTVNTTERQFIQGSYNVRGGLALTGVNDGSFYNLELENDQGWVFLKGNTDVRNTVNFQPGSVIINSIATSDIGTTGAYTIPANGSNYTYTFGMMNSASGLGNFINNTVSTNGSMTTFDNAYIVGKLRRAISPGGGVFGFPMGLEPTATNNSRGIQYTSLDIAVSNTYDVITGYFEQGSDNTSTEAWNCAPTTYWIDYFAGTDHGEWILTDITSSGTGVYEISLWPQNHTIAANTIYAITKDNDLTGTTNDCGSSTTGLSRGGFQGFSEFGIAGSSNVLPVELLNIEAYSVENKSIIVDWTTATEINNNGFEVERSTNGMFFEKIGWVEGNGNTSNVIDYVYNDKNVVTNTTYYYRLKQVDFDGQSEYTKVVSAKTNRDKNYIISSVYPNPTKNSSNIKIITPINQKGTIKMYNALGKLILFKEIKLTKGANTINLKTNAYLNGLYHIKIDIDNETIKHRLIISK